MTKGNEISVSSEAGSPWNRFWFGESGRQQAMAGAAMAAVRIGLAVMAFWYFASHWSDIGLWFAGDGVLSSKSLGVFLADAELGETVSWRLSPLYWVDSPLLLRGYLLVGMMLAIALPLVRSTRAVAVALWLAVVWLANRSMIVSGLEEVTLAWGLAYLAIAAPGRPSVDRLAQDGWTASLAQRLIQIHLSIVFLVTGLSMLASLAWWDGTGVMAIVSPAEIRYFDLNETLQSPRIHEPLTHAIVVGAIALPVLLWNRSTQTVGFCLAIAWSIGLAVLSSQCLHFLAMAMLAMSFLPEKWLNSLFFCTDS